MTLLRIVLAVLSAVAVLGTATALFQTQVDPTPTPRDGPVPAGGAEVLVVVDSDDRFAAAAVAHVRTALGRAKVPFREFDLDAGQRAPDFGEFRAVLTVTERLRRLADADVGRLGAFVRGGGGLAMLYRGYDERLAPLLGMVSDGPPGFGSREERFTFTAPILPGGEDLALLPNAFSPLDLDAAPDCDVFAERDGARAAAWTCTRGAGRVAVWNTSTLGGKWFRGHLLQTLALVHPAHVRPMAGVAVVYLDDFPSPASNEPVEPVWTAHGQTPAEFYATRWYPDMLAIADRYRLVYTSTAIYSYNGRTRAPFPIAEWLTGKVGESGRAVPYAPSIMARDARRSEMALHGYNHEPLRLDVWGDRAPMVEALGVARRRWIAEGSAPLPTTYVPPMNRIDSVGVSALREAFPEVETIAGLYFGPAELGQDREFGPEPWAPELYALPRNTAGYVFGDVPRLQTLTLLQTVGVWSHFVHPDDPYPNDDRAESYDEMGLRNPSDVGWEGPSGLRAEFERWIEFVHGHYPWIETVTASEAAARMRAFDRLSLSWTPRTSGDGRTLEVRLSQPGQRFLTWARPGERLVGVDGGTVLDVWEGRLLSQYAVRASGPDVTLRFQTLPTP